MLTVPTTLLLATLTAGPVPAAQTHLDDAAITRAVELEILVQRGVELDEVDVRTDKGVVTLTGTLDNILARERAVDIAGTIRGVRAVVDRLELDPPDRDESALTADVREALEVDPAVDAAELELDVDDGTVTLRGTVDSYPERNLAAVRAKGVLGVSAVRNDIVVYSDTRRSDSEIADEVGERLSWHVLIDDSFLDVEVDDGQVRISGMVGAVAERTLLHQLGWVAGVESVDTSKVEIGVDADLQREATSPSDADMVRGIEAALAYDPRVDITTVSVTVDEGVAVLGGAVDSLEAKRAAESDARNTHGVWAVDNLLRVRPTLVVSDEVLTDRVQGALERDPWLDDATLHASAHEGAVWLRGEVDSDFQEARAVTLAGRVDGVRKVVERIALDDDLPLVYTDSFGAHWVGIARSDQELARAVHQQLFWSPWIDAEEVDVHVDGGEVRLTGTVDTYWQRSEAVENAWEAGALSVVDELRVEIRSGSSKL